MLHIILKGVCESEVEGTCVKEWEVTYFLYIGIYTQLNPLLVTQY